MDELNLNLMATLDVLLEEKNLRRAAIRRGVTQSAMSHALRQLRELLGDPLLVRAGGETTLTPRAQAIAGPLRRAIADLARAVATEPAFVPLASERRFRIIASDAVAVTLIPALSQPWARSAPQLRLEVLPSPTEPIARLLEAGDADLAVTPVRPEEPGLKARALYATAFAVLCRRKHPRVGDALDLETFCALPHVVVGTGVGTPIVDRALAAIGRQRQVTLTVPYFLAAPAIVERSDHLLTLPDGAARYFARSRGLKMFAPPLKLPSGRVFAVWHERYDRDVGLRWLRDEVVRAGRSIDGQP